MFWPIILVMGNYTTCHASRHKKVLTHVLNFIVIYKKNTFSDTEAGKSPVWIKEVYRKATSCFSKAY